MSKKKLKESNQGAYKPWFDFAVLLLAHLLLLPVWLLLWGLIPLIIWIGDRGPIFYRHERVGKDGNVFTVLKFRTMVQHADRKGPAWTTEDDPRVTRVGRLLRRTALDELPEIINICKGHMSLVGPRALSVDEHQALEEQIPGFSTRLRVRPGLTGLAQVYDRLDNAPDKFRYDLDYLQRMSPWLDITILALSVRNTLTVRWDRRSGKPASGSVTPTLPGGATHRDASVSREDVGAKRTDSK